MKNKLAAFPLRPGDAVIFLAIIAAACGIWLHLVLLQTDQTYGEIWLDGALYQQIKLDDSTKETIRLEGKNSEVTIEADGRQMRFILSECPDHTCERTGWISGVGQTAVCLPNRVMIKITGSTGDEDAVDAVVQ
ncbi:MAG: NusG domain II-containing protein [Eubacteriales bacterium]|nr:NusG domain II-containing protein [Eubacteriales bacterium]